MAFLELNGITVPVTNGSMTKRIERRGERSRSFKGALRDSRRGLRRQWELEICFPEREEGEAFIRWFQGDGHFFDFAEGPEGSTWLHPNAGLDGLQFASNVWGAKGRGVGHVKSRSPALAPSGFFRVDAQLGDEWTVLWSEKRSDVTTYEALYWDFMAKRSDGVGYESGTREDRVGEEGVGFSNTSVNVVDGEVILRNDFAVDYGIDDVLILPWKMPESWIATLTSATTPAPKLPAMPVLTARGDFIEEEYAYVVGDVTGVEFVQRPSRIPGVGWVNNAMRIRARLSQVDPAYYCVEERIEETVKPPGTVQPAYWFTASDIDNKSNATLNEGDPVTAWANLGFATGQASSIDINTPTFRARGDFPLFRSPVVQCDVAGSRLQTIVPTNLLKPLTALCVYRTTDQVGTATQYMSDGAVTSNRLIFRSGPYGNQQVYNGTFLPGTGINTATARTWNVGVAEIDGANSTYIWNGSTSIGNAGAQAGLQGMTLFGLASSTSSSAFASDLVEVLVYQGDPGVNGVPTLAQLEQYVIDRYLEGG